MNIYRLLVVMIATCNVQAFAASGLYIGGGFGNAKVDDQIPSNQNVSDINFRSDDTAYKLFGGLRMETLAAEIGYVDFGKPADKGVSLQLTALDAFASLDFFSVGPLAAFIKGGLVRWDYDLKNISSNLKKTGTDAAYGVGARFDFGALAFRVEYELFDIGEVDDLYLFSASVGYTFL